MWTHTQISHTSQFIFYVVRPHNQEHGATSGSAHMLYKMCRNYYRLYHDFTQ